MTIWEPIFGGCQGIVPWYDGRRYDPLCVPFLSDGSSIDTCTCGFHRKHASIYDLIFRQGWQVVALIDDVISDLGDLAG